MIPCILGVACSLLLNYINYDKLYKLAHIELLKTSKKLSPEDYSLNLSILSPLICITVAMLLSELYTQVTKFFEPVMAYVILSTVMFIQNRISGGNWISWITSCIELIVLIYGSFNHLAIVKLIVNLQMIQLQKHVYRDVWSENLKNQEPIAVPQTEPVQVKIRTIMVQPACSYTPDPTKTY
jgi:hypothetical protein